MNDKVVDSAAPQKREITNEYILQKAVELAGATLCTADISKLSFTPVKGGITNLIYSIKSTESGSSVLARIYGDKTEYIVNRKREVGIVEVLSKFGLSKKIYGYFEGGQIEEWIEGTTMSGDTIRDPVNMIGIAKTMKMLHSVPLCESFYNITDVQEYMGDDYYGKSILFPKINMLYYKIMSKYDHLKDDFSELDFEKLKHDINVLFEMCNKVNSPVVLCHGDLLPPNVISTKDGIRFIDYEYSCPMERGYDIANHLMEYIGFEVDLSRLPTREEEALFLCCYLDTSSPEEINTLSNEIRPFYFASNLFWGLWSVFQHLYSKVDFCFGEYAKQKLGLFLSPEYRMEHGWPTTC